LNGAAMLELLRGRSVQARAMFERALKLIADPDNDRHAIALRGNLGALAIDAGELDAAESYLRGSFALAERIRNATCVHLGTTQQSCLDRPAPRPAARGGAGAGAQRQWARRMDTGLRRRRRKRTYAAPSVRPMPYTLPLISWSWMRRVQRRRRPSVARA
jgi:hypothetical protein